MLLRSAFLASALGLATASSFYSPGSTKRHDKLARRQDINVDVDVSVNATITTGGGEVEEIEQVASAWYTEWHSQFVTLDQVPWDKYTHVYYAFMYVFIHYLGVYYYSAFCGAYLTNNFYILKLFENIAS